MSNIIVLNHFSPAVKHLCKNDKCLKKVISMVGEIKYELHEEGYSFLVRVIIEQMLSIKAASKIYNRLIELCGGEITKEKISSLSTEQIRKTGTSISKATYIKDITTSIISHQFSLEKLAHKPDEEVLIELTSLKGVGMWTAKMYLIFVLNRQDILPFEDVAFLNSYRWMYKTDLCKSIEVIEKCKNWKPYSSIAARYLYRALDLGLTKIEFNLFE